MRDRPDDSWETGAVARLPATFTHAQAKAEGLSDRSFYWLRDEGLIIPIARGLYRRRAQHSADIELVEIALRAPMATLCLTTMLTEHQLCDVASPYIDVALPRGRHRPTTESAVAWHAFDPATFDIGRGTKRLGDGVTIGIYSPERCIIDAIRLRHHEGTKLGYKALQRWVDREGSSPAHLLAMARKFPQAERALREALEVLL